jgi:hypothetical protein
VRPCPDSARCTCCVSLTSVSYLYSVIAPAPPTHSIMKCAAPFLKRLAADDKLTFLDSGPDS